MTHKVLVTGAGGYIGSLMVEYLLNKKYSVVALDRFYFGNTLRDLISNPLLRVIKADTRLVGKSLFKSVDWVIDLASLSNDPSADLNPKITTSINHDGPLKIASLAKAAGVKKYIFSSSCSVYGAGIETSNETSVPNPISTYGRSKLAAETDLLKMADHEFSVTILRNATVYGLSARRMRFDLIVNLMTLHAWANHKIYVMGGGRQWRPLVHVSDVISAFETVIDEPNLQKINGQIFNVGSNLQNYQVYQVAQMFKEKFPEVSIEETPDDPDPRNYRVSFDKIGNVLKYHTRKTVKDGIFEIRKALEEGTITDSVTTNTGKYYKYLLEADKLLSDIKINNKLFEL